MKMIRISCCLLVSVFLCTSLNAREPGWTTVFLVRHAEKAEGRDPSLTETGRARASRLAELLSAAGIDVVFSSQYLRTRETVAPVAAVSGAAAVVVDAGAPDQLVQTILSTHRGEQVLIAGHSNTVPDLVRRLGAPEPAPIEESEHHHLFVVTIGPDDQASVIQLRY